MFAPQEHSEAPTATVLTPAFHIVISRHLHSCQVVVRILQPYRLKGLLKGVLKILTAVHAV